jgi:KUP system potassium uptake protein
VYDPTLSTSAIIGISAAILVLLFAVQPLGINRLANFYAPIVAFWLLFNLGCGLYNIAKFDAGILKAFYPYYAFKWFWVKGPDAGFHRLGGILLCFTGESAFTSSSSSSVSQSMY